MRFVKKAKYLSDYKIELIFDNKKIKIVDLKPYLRGEIFEPLKDINYFRTVKVNPDLDTIAWNNGADVAPEFLYKIGKPKLS